MKKSFRDIFVISFIILLIDQITKFHIQNILSLSESIPIINNIFHLTLVYNKGIAFGLLQGGATALVFVSLLVIFSLIMYVRLDQKSHYFRIPIALILGGALGNLIDRLRLGYIIDFLDFRVWPVFNIADSAITVGGLLLFYFLIKE